MTIRRLGNPNGELASITCRECEQRVMFVNTSELSDSLKTQALADVRSDPHYLEPQTTTPEVGEQLVVEHDAIMPRHTIVLYRHNRDQQVFED